MPPDTIIHVVDDDHSFRTAIGGLLSASGYGVALYNSARDFLEKLSPASSGCILLDVQMPGLSGLELQSRLKSAECSMPIIFLTGHADIPTAVADNESGGAKTSCANQFGGTTLFEWLKKLWLTLWSSRGAASGCAFCKRVLGV